MSMAFSPTSIPMSIIPVGASRANGISARAHSARGNPPCPSTATPPRWPVFTAGWICGNSFDAADSLGLEAHRVRGVPHPRPAPRAGSAECHGCTEHGQRLARRRPGESHAAHLRPMDAELPDDHPVYDAAAGSDSLDPMAAVSADVRVIRLF